MDQQLAYITLIVTDVGGGATRIFGMDRRVITTLCLTCPIPQGIGAFECPKAPGKAGGFGDVGDGLRGRFERHGISFIPLCSDQRLGNHARRKRVHKSCTILTLR